MGPRRFREEKGDLAARELAGTKSCEQTEKRGRGDGDSEI